MLHFGGDIDRAALDALAARLRGALELARDRGALDMDADAHAVWPALYGELSADEDGLLGAVTGRAEAQVRRLAVLYALLDSTDVVGIDHLRAAVAVWGYSRRRRRTSSVARRATLSPTSSRRNSRSPGPEGLSRSEIRDLIGGRTSAERIDTALARLEARGIARCEREPSGPAGGPPRCSSRSSPAGLSGAAASSPKPTSAPSCAPS
ncbi:MAG: hypothetical protein M3433_00990 [Actinomycetota bacterium]|nr:hypothetical protein [Actinomycetota bacterium]